ncbi:MAG: hypothetical protein IJD33_03565 [Clostridia bacterium]|nr:hypothetical protein [Clostridia bacterium]
MKLEKLRAIVQKAKNAVGMVEVWEENAVDYVCGDGDALPLPLSTEEERKSLEKIGLYYLSMHLGLTTNPSRCTYIFKTHPLPAPVVSWLY